ncbi:hypothetical protein COCSADRAFT_184122 [Bipolaris sorokiniana ND90Pr]|uniref:Uncharacterized protein n=1 Tax=Cochliobolus sativus (strain ND90Pr / ATCC 201652) TaxID=665912 RepID=M2SFP5_COCSN|nr:uncharacterized protein COCSADRAFT_184122 [Bipolaris sorokiniana ND90Pr]EMD61265.1 hypothetical protein COCSADRAFT_184122 [Bipolaris sorokiniana ND90Pr]
MCKHLIYTPRDQCSICIEEEKSAPFEGSTPIPKVEEKPEVSFNNLGPIQKDDQDCHGQWNNLRDYKALSDVDSITSHWRLDDLDEALGPKPTVPSSLHTSLSTLYPTACSSKLQSQRPGRILFHHQRKKFSTIPMKMGLVPLQRCTTPTLHTT